MWKRPLSTRRYSGAGRDAEDKMGDRAYMEVVCRRSDAAVFEDLGFCEQDWRTELPEDVAFLVDDEANYGHDDSIRRLAAEGLAFCARHGEGGDYHAAVIASDGSRFCSIETLFGDGRPHVPVQPDGTIEGDAMRNATEYYRIEAAARQVLGVTETLFSG
jgi:hypothetical protein